MNKVILMGRLTRDPEVRYSQGASQTAVARFSVAVDRRFKREGEPDADFFNCTCFGKQAEFVERYLHKGTKIVLSGRVQNDNYTNKEGQMVYSVRIIADEIEFAESKNASGGSGDGGYNGGGYNNGGYGDKNNAPAASGAGDGFMNIPDGIDEELPFN
ncbi:MAG: single-stranded DNA-binding protein [Butyrivibrio sp.]|nr:single-stranded DNA-binding protein [Acetatifactor muris]MCM1558262.1 single-stranded DNA-binding protein [Butyrivibrio sp.]